MNTPLNGDSPIRQVDWPEAIRFAAIQSQLLDFDLALNALGRIRHYSTFCTMDPVIRHALYATALSYYARAFKSGVRGNPCTSDSLNFSPEEKKEHERLIALRDKWIAHSVNPLDQVEVGIILTSFEDDASIVDIARIRHRKLNISNDKVQRIEDFIRSVRRKIEVKNQEAYEQLLTKARVTPVYDLQRLPELSMVIPDDDLNTVTTKRNLKKQPTETRQS
jgi:hypothetical protein